MAPFNAAQILGKHCRYTAVFMLVAVPILFCIFFYPFSPGDAASLLTSENDVTGDGDEGKLHVFLDNVLLQFDSKILLDEEDPMLPLRSICEQAGFTVQWENEVKRATLYGAGVAITLYPGNPLYAVNGVLKRTEQPPRLRDGRLMVSLDFLEKGVGVVLREGALEKGYLHLEFHQPKLTDEGAGVGGDPAGREQPVYFVELLLPPEDRVTVDESFEMSLAAPFVRGIYAYEVSFFYNPEIIQVKDVRNPTYEKSHEFYMKEINNREGTMRYTLTTLGAKDDLQPRHTLAVIEAVVFREGAVPLIEGTLKVTLLDNRARTMPVGLEERVLYVGGPDAAKEEDLP